MTKLLGINVVFLYVADLEGARRFYEDQLGLPAPVIQTDEWVEYALAQGAHFALHRTLPQALEGADPTRNTVAFSFMIDDLDEAVRIMQAKGVVFIRPPESGPGFRLAECTDPEGNPIRLIQGPPAQVQP